MEAIKPFNVFQSVLLLALAGWLMSGCSSNPPAEYHLLPVKPLTSKHDGVSPAEYTNPNTPCISLGVDRLILPEYLNNDNIIGLLSESTIQVSQQRLWYEPLDGAMKRALTLELIDDLPTIRIQEFPWRQDDQPVCRLTVIFFELIQVSRERWTAKIQWQLHHPPHRTYFSDTGLEIELSETELARDLPQAYAYLQAIESTSQIVSSYVKSLPQLKVEIERTSTAPKSGKSTGSKTKPATASKG